MNEYDKQALAFLTEAGTTCTIEYAGYMFNEDWDNQNKHDLYYVTLKNERGEYRYKYWDSIYNTETNHMNYDDYMKKHPKVTSTYQANKELKKLQAENKVKEYDVLACLTAYEVGTFEDFCYEFGYDNDSIKAYKTYVAVCEEWNGLRKVFTYEQLEKLAEIQ